jgi:hypothetical protein
LTPTLPHATQQIKIATVKNLKKNHARDGSEIDLAATKMAFLDFDLYSGRRKKN